jgi:heme-degrading monooxygenase HmoA
MIVRLWHGRVPSLKAKAYREFLIERAIPDYNGIEGNISVEILEREDGDVTHFLTVTHWINLDAIKAFAGKDIDKAKYYPEDKNFLLEFEEKVQHYEVVKEA